MWCMIRAKLLVPAGALLHSRGSVRSGAVAGKLFRECPSVGDFRAAKREGCFPLRVTDGVRYCLNAGRGIGPRLVAVIGRRRVPFPRQRSVAVGALEVLLSLLVIRALKGERIAPIGVQSIADIARNNRSLRHPQFGQRGQRTLPVPRMGQQRTAKNQNTQGCKEGAHRAARFLGHRKISVKTSRRLPV
jgi:hypothetical protein